MSPDGYISITGRIKDLIIRGGENIHPLEIENCLLAHPAIADVSVVGVPDERYGEVVAAFVIARDQGPKAITAEEIRKYVREELSNHLGQYLRSSYFPCLWFKKVLLTIMSSSEVRFLPRAVRGFPQNGEWKDPEIQAKREGYQVFEQGSRTLNKRLAPVLSCTYVNLLWLELTLALSVKR